MKKILFVEDDDYFRELYSEQLRSEGYEVIECNDGAEALKKTLEKKPDLVILDIMLPVMNGLDVLKKIKEGEATRNTKVVLLTNLGQEGIIKEGFKLGADGYLMKPALTPAQMLKEMTAYL